MRPVYYAYIPVLALIGAYFMLQKKEAASFSITVAPPLIAAPTAKNLPQKQVATVPSSHPARGPNHAHNNRDIEKFLENGTAVKSLLARDIKQLVDIVASLEIPDGSITREKGHFGKDSAYREMRTNWGAEIKKISQDERMVSETYSSSNREQFLRREFNSEGRLRTMALRWSGREGIMVDFYNDGQISNISEAVNGETTTQKWDLEGQLIEHQSVRVIDGQYEKIDHIRNTVTHSMNEIDDARDD